MTFTLAGQTYTPTQVVQLATSLLAADNATVLAKAAYAEAVAAEKKLLATDGKVVQQLRESLALIFSNSPTTLADLRDRAEEDAEAPVDPGPRGQGGEGGGHSSCKGHDEQEAEGDRVRKRLGGNHHAGHHRDARDTRRVPGRDGVRTGRCVRRVARVVHG